jgi:hypothetical protein
MAEILPYSLVFSSNFSQFVGSFIFLLKTFLQPLHTGMSMLFSPGSAATVELHFLFSTSSLSYFVKGVIGYSTYFLPGGNTYVARFWNSVFRPMHDGHNTHFDLGSTPQNQVFRTSLLTGHPVLAREGICKLLEPEEDLQLVGQVLFQYIAPCENYPNRERP